MMKRQWIETPPSVLHFC